MQADGIFFEDKIGVLIIIAVRTTKRSFVFFWQIHERFAMFIFQRKRETFGKLFGIRRTLGIFVVVYDMEGLAIFQNGVQFVVKFMILLYSKELQMVNLLQRDRGFRVRASFWVECSVEYVEHKRIQYGDEGVEELIQIKNFSNA